MLIEAYFLLTSVLVHPAISPSVPVVAQASAAETISATQVAKRVQAFYRNNARLTAKFRQVYTNTVFGKKSISDGMVWLKKTGGKMRWDYYQKARRGEQPKVEKSIVSDGEMLWGVEHDNKQYFKQSLKDTVLPVAVTFLTGQGELATNFDAELDTSGTYGSKREHVLKLTPKQPSAQYKTLWLVVSPDNFRVTQSIVLESSGNTNHFRFFSPDFEKEVKDAWFTLDEKVLRKRRYRQIKGK